MTAGGSSETSRLLRRAADGDPASWGALLTRHGDRLRRMVAFRLDQRLQGRVDPSDVVQDAYLEASKHLADYLRGPQLPFFLWLRGIATNKLRELHRHHLGAQMRDAGREVSLYRGPMPETTSARLNREQREANTNWQHAQKAEREAKEELVQSRLSQARAGRFGRQAGRRFDGLKALAEAARLARELSAPEDRLLALRNEAIACMALTDVRSVRRLEDLAWPQLGTGYELQLAFDDRWEFYARGDAHGHGSVRRLADDREVAGFSRPGQVAPILLFSPDGRYLAAKWYRAHSAQPVEYVVWEWRRGKQVVRQALEVATSPAIDFAFGRDSRQVILGGRRDGSLGFYEFDSGRQVRHLNVGRDAPFTIALHPEGRRLAPGADGGVVIRSLDTGAVLASWKQDGVWGLAWHPEGKALAAAGHGCVHLFDPTTGRQRSPASDPDQIIHAAFNHAGTLLASWGWGDVTRLWDPQSGKELLVASGHGFAFSPDDQSLAYRSYDEVGIWEVAHERVYRTLREGPGVAHGVQFSPDGRLLASATDGGRWPVGHRRRPASRRPAVGPDHFRPVSPDGRHPRHCGRPRPLPLAAPTGGRRPGRATAPRTAPGASRPRE